MGGPFAGVSLGNELYFIVVVFYADTGQPNVVILTVTVELL